MATRRKAARQEAPQTLNQALACIAEYRDLLDKIDELDTDARQAIAKIEHARDTFTLPLKLRAGILFLQLRTWWAVAAPELTEGKRKSLPLAGVLIGERTTPPALKLPKGKDADAVVAELMAHGGNDFIVTTRKLDKPAIIRALRLEDLDPVEDAMLLHEIDVMANTIGLSVAQKEEFFLARPDPAPATEIVPEAADAEAA